MSKLIIPAATAVLLAMGVAVLPAAPALAQRSKVSQIIVYGKDPCPRSTDDEVVVCARKDERERFRIPEDLREGGSLQSRDSWANKARSFETVGATGINSCSPVGPAGYTGCNQQVINQAFRERRAQARADTAPIK